MRRVNDLSKNPLSMTTKAAGKLPEKSQASNGNSFDHQMELDDQLQRESNPPTIPPMLMPSPIDPNLSFGDGVQDDTMDMGFDYLRPSHSAQDAKNMTANHDNLLIEALEFGQELKAEFSDDLRPAVVKALDDTFALIAYQDARESVVGGLMEGKGRVEIAEEVNSAILGMLFRVFLPPSVELTVMQCLLVSHHPQHWRK